MRLAVAPFALTFSLALAVLAPLPVLAEAAPSPAVAALPAITVSEVGRLRLRDRVLASGLVGPVERVQVQPLIEGQPIQMLAVDVGDRVAAGQVLAQLSSSTLELQKSQFLASLAAARATIAQVEAQLVEARSSADEAQRVSVRSATLKAQGIASQAAADQAAANAISATARVSVAAQSLEAARAQLTLVEAQLANVELQLSRTKVVAPVSGEVVERNAQLGSVASAAGQPMFVLIRDGALELRADIAERDLLRLAVGQVAQLVAVGTDAPLTGTVRLVEPTIDTQTRMGRARITIDRPEMLRSGMFVDAVILVAERDALAVPVTAVGSSPEGATVMRVQDGLVARVRVVTGIRDSGMVEIVSGLAEGDLLVTKAKAFVRDGDRINPVPAMAETN
ncbi:MAG: efflux RND transporter periplasmic adaptor subunit [Pseudorhodobacter sp.]|nr:efflux RND transporter periplasmic adaptor subunit [Pseudorhodobacter sp.]